MSAGFYDPLAEAPGVEDENPAKVEALRTPVEEQAPKGREKRKPLIEFLRPSEIAAYVAPENHFLVGDSLIQRGAMTVFAGPGGVGKSRAVFQLAVAAARGESSWMGFPIHFGFKTLVIQSENGLPRLSKDFIKLGDAAGLDGRLLVSKPPDAMLAMKNPHFRADVVAAAKEFGPDLIVCDPLNSMVSDSQERDIIELLTYLRQMIGETGTNPALLIVHHLRKPRDGDKHKGRAMANLLAGSYVITSSARAVLTLAAATDGEDDPHAVLTVAKCNDGEMPPRSAWRRTEGGFFSHCDDFNWEAFDGQSGPVAKIREEHIFKVFANGSRGMSLAAAAKELQRITDSGRSAAYNALDPRKGRFATLIEEDLIEGTLRLSPEGKRQSLAEGEED